MGTWVPQLALDFGSGHDLRVVRSSTTSGSMLGMEPAEDSLSPSPFALPPSKKINKIRAIESYQEL